MRGVQTEVDFDAPALHRRQIVLSSVRVLREYQSMGTLPPGVEPDFSLRGRKLSWSRQRLDGELGYRV